MGYRTHAFWLPREDEGAAVNKPIVNETIAYNYFNVSFVIKEKNYEGKFNLSVKYISFRTFTQSFTPIGA